MTLTSDFVVFEIEDKAMDKKSPNVAGGPPNIIHTTMISQLVHKAPMIYSTKSGRAEYFPFCYAIPYDPMPDLERANATRIQIF